MIEWTVTVTTVHGEAMRVSTWDRAEAFRFLAGAVSLLEGRRTLTATLHAI